MVINNKDSEFMKKSIIFLIIILFLVIGTVNGEITKVGDLATAGNSYTPSPDSLFVDSTCLG